MNETQFAQFIDDAMKALPAEAKVVKKVIKALKKNGTPVHRVWDGYEHVRVDTQREVLEQVFNLDEAWLKTEDGSWVRITLGNEWDCLTDYTIDLEDALQEVNDYIDRHN